MAMTNEELIDPLKELLAEEGLKARWKVGRLLNKQVGLRAVYGTRAMMDIARGVGVSESFLAGCRLLGRHWDDDAIDAAVHHGVSVRRAFKLVVLDAQAQRLEAQEKKAEAKQAISERKKLLRTYPRSGAGDEEQADWSAQLCGSLQRARKERCPRIARRTIRDARDAIIGDLGRASERFNRPGFRWPGHVKSEREKVLAGLASVKAKMDELFDSLKKERRVET